VVALVEPPADTATAVATTRALSPERLEEIRRVNLASFEMVWTTIRDRHYDAELAGVDWEAARARYEPMVTQAGSVEEARNHMQAMIDLLGQSHMAIIPGSAYEAYSGEQDSPEAEDPDDRDDVDEPAADADDEWGGSDEGETGMDVRLADVEKKQVLVTSVKPGSGAAQAGVRPGWQLVRVGEREVSELVEAIAGSLAERGRGKPEMYVSFAIQNRLHGRVGKSIEATFLDAEGKEQQVKIPLQTSPGEVTRLGALPPVRVDFNARRIERDGVTLGYVGFNAFLDPGRLGPLIDAAMKDFASAEDPVDGVVLDVRGNMGGIVMMVPGIAGYFVDEKDVHMGTLQTRDTQLKLVIFPRLTQFAGPVAVLTDACSVSAAELLSGGLQAIGRARVFGMATAGEALPAQMTRLPNGDGFLFVFADYETPGDQRLEGDGVLPDEVVPYDRQALLSGDDPILAAAARWVASDPRPATRPAGKPAE
jgi:carboxyl-terminal processing protease